MHFIIMKKIVITFFLSFVLVSCSSGNENIIPSTNTTFSIPVTYVAGQEYDLGAHDFYSRVWKDGVAQLSLVNNTQPAAVLKFFINGNDIYTCGMIGGGSQARGFIHKNGVALLVSTSFASISSIFVSGNDVYAVGGTHAIGEVLMWKNGVETTISPVNNTTFKSIAAYSIYVAGTDVYICGAEEVGFMYKRKAIMWKNGIKSTLFEHPNTSVWAHQIVVSSNDVYVAMTGRLWKNGVITPLNNSAQSNYAIEATGIFVVGADVYICGYSGNSSTVAVYWKNGVSINLPEGVEANAIYVKNNDVYVVGIGNEPPVPNAGSFYKGLVWKNGIIENTFPHSTPRDVFVN